MRMLMPRRGSGGSSEAWGSRNVVRRLHSHLRYLQTRYYASAQTQSAQTQSAQSLPEFLYFRALVANYLLLLTAFLRSVIGSDVDP